MDFFPGKVVGTAAVLVTTLRAGDQDALIRPPAAESHVADWSKAALPLLTL